MVQDKHGQSIMAKIPMVLYDGRWFFYFIVQQNIAHKKYGAIAATEDKGIGQQNTEWINDGKYRLYWASDRSKCIMKAGSCSGDYISADPHRIYIDFGIKRVINNVRIMFHNDSYPFNYQIQYFDREWKTAATINGNYESVLNNVFMPVNTSIIAVYVVESADRMDFVQINEFEVYNLFDDTGYDKISALHHTLIGSEEEKRCYDSDGSDDSTLGNFAYIAGECTDIKGNKYYDVCIGTSAVYEFGCTPQGECKKIGWACPSGECEKGACTKE